MQTMAVAAEFPWHKQSNPDAAAESDHANTMVVTGKRLAATGADRKFFTCDIK